MGDTTQLERRQADNAFDHNPDGSQFLWVLQDTYQGKTFFECVAAHCSIDSVRLYLSQKSVGVFHGERSNQVSHASCLATEMTAANACTTNPLAEK